MQSITLALAALASTVAATDYFGLIAARSASPIHYREINAADYGLFIGKDTVASCPENIEALGACPAGNTTDFTIANGLLQLGANVPGGQQAFIDPCDGAIGYTQPHSVAMPEGAIVEGFSYVEGEQFGTLQYTGGLFACPADGDDVWKIYAGGVEGVELAKECLSFNALAPSADGPAAWQYE